MLRVVFYFPCRSDETLHGSLYPQRPAKQNQVGPECLTHGTFSRIKDKSTLKPFDVMHFALRSPICWRLQQQFTKHTYSYLKQTYMFIIIHFTCIMWLHILSISCLHIYQCTINGSSVAGAENKNLLKMAFVQKVKVENKYDNTWWICPLS